MSLPEFEREADARVMLEGNHHPYGKERNK